VFAALVALAAHADGIGLKPGLWEVRVVKQVVDGRDLSAQMAGVNDRMRQAVASMPPEQRAQREAMMRQRGAGAGHEGSTRICVSPEMARRDRPFLVLMPPPRRALSLPCAAIALRLNSVARTTARQRRVKDHRRRVRA
jgi:hypothetical protein